MRAVLVSFCLSLAYSLSACSVADAPAAQDPNAPLSGSATIFAAASLTEAFEAVGQAFEADHPGTRLKFSFAGSQNLRTQIEQGARANIFASANPKHMEALRAQKLVDAPRVFALNRLVLVVPADNPAKIEGLADLSRTDRVVLAHNNVPAGSYADQILENAKSTYGEEFRARVKSQVVSRELDVRQTLQKVMMGEANAAIVYATDAAAAGDKVRTIEIPAEFNVTAKYPVAAVENTSGSRLSHAFLQYLQGQGSEILKRHGFRVPTLASTN